MLPEEPEPIVGVSRATVRRAVQSWTRAAQITSWRNTGNCRQAKQTVSGPQKTRTRDLLKLGRRKLRAVVGVLTGHFRLRRHLHIMQLVDSPLCEQCMEADETALHFIGECPAFTRARLLHLGSDVLTTDDIAMARTRDLASFIEETGRFNNDQ